MSWSFNIGSIAGTQVRIHVTFVLFLAWIFAASYASGGAEAAWSGTAFLTLLFLCVLAHEFGHIFTARRFGVKNSFDAKDNIEGGVRYLKFLQETFKDERLAIAAYNAGEGAVQKYGNVPPYQETMSYVAKVGRKYGQARRAELQEQLAKQAADNQAKQPEHRPLAQFIDSEGRLHLTTQ